MRRDFPEQVVPALKEQVEIFKDLQPVLANLRNPALKERHWARIHARVDRPIGLDDGYSVSQLLESQVPSLPAYLERT